MNSTNINIQFPTNRTSHDGIYMEQLQHWLLNVNDIENA